MTPIEQIQPTLREKLTRMREMSVWDAETLEIIECLVAKIQIAQLGFMFYSTGVVDSGERALLTLKAISLSTPLPTPPTEKERV